MTAPLRIEGETHFPLALLAALQLQRRLVQHPAAQHQSVWQEQMGVPVHLLQEERLPLGEIFQSMMQTEDGPAHMEMHVLHMVRWCTLGLHLRQPQQHSNSRASLPIDAIPEAESFRGVGGRKPSHVQRRQILRGDGVQCGGSPASACTLSTKGGG